MPKANQNKNLKKSKKDFSNFLNQIYYSISGFQPMKLEEYIFSSQENYKTFRANAFQLLNHIPEYYEELNRLINDNFELICQY